MCSLSRCLRRRITASVSTTTSQYCVLLSLFLIFGATCLLVDAAIHSNAGDATNDEAQHQHQHQRVRVNLGSLGVVQGVRKFGIDFFGGIPFAAPPVGNLRWAPPEDPPSWKPHLLDASQFGPDCHQIVDPVANPLAHPEQMSEDCLYLNIFTPAGASTRARKHFKKSSTTSTNNNLLPVMIWFHGGAFQQGSGNRPEYDGQRLAQEEMVVVVTVNYRLGSLGFMVSSELGLLGNYGLMDQRAAMYWVQKHIATFGGNPNSITLFGESAGAVMIGLHLQMHNPNLFHKAILQSNPMGYQFRSVVVADFLGDALRRAVDCRDLPCLRSEPVEEIMRAQSSLMGIPRSVGDFFAWGPTLTHQRHVSFLSSSPLSSSSNSNNNFGFGGGTTITPQPQQRPSKTFNLEHRSLFSVENYAKQRESSKYAVNVTQPLLNLHLVPDEIPIIIGTNKHEGEMFVHTAFPISMSKAVYWMFVGALFKDSASRVLKHYRSYVIQLEKEGQIVAEQQLKEEENKQYYMEHQDELDEEYLWLLLKSETNSSGKVDNDQDQVISPETVEQLVKTFQSGGGDAGFIPGNKSSNDTHNDNSTDSDNIAWWKRVWNNPRDLEKIQERSRIRREKIQERIRTKALKEAAKVVIDYRPVMSRIINDYLFRCPSWQYAHLLSHNRVRKNNDNHHNNVYVYRFSQPTHVPGYKECWGKSCHTSELPYVFRSMDVIRSNYSTLSSYAQAEAPSTPEYPYTEMLDAYRGKLEEKQQSMDVTASDQNKETTSLNSGSSSGKQGATSSWNHTETFQNILNHFFGDYFKEDADEETASDMAQRWVAFAQSGAPNYSGAKVEWIPWRYIPKEGLKEESFEELLPWSQQQYYEIWSDVEQDSAPMDEKEGLEGFFWSEDRLGRAYRRRALQALNMEVVEQDELRSELKRTKSNGHDPENPFLKALSSLGVTPWNEEASHNEGQIPLRTIRQVQRIAQDMGVLGTGLHGDDRLEPHNYWDNDFFPQLLELKWPPEGRLVERDCTCDFWEKIRYRY